MASNDALARARSKLKANKLTQVTKEDGTTFQINIYDAAAPPKNKMKKAPPAYLEARQPPKYVEVPRFNFSDEKERTAGLAYLEENGYVVAKGVLNDKEVEKAKSLFWDFIEGIPNRYELSEKTKAEWPHRGKASTWSKKFPGNQGNGIINKQGAGQAPFAWFCRSRDKVAEVFSAVWETSDLIVSFDGFNAFRPWKINPSWRTKGARTFSPEKGEGGGECGRRALRNYWKIYERVHALKGCCAPPPFPPPNISRRVVPCRSKLHSQTWEDLRAGPSFNVRCQ